MVSGDAHNLRLQRAWKHIDEFKRDVHRWANDNPYCTVREDDPQAGVYLWRAKLQKEPPPILGLIAGDAVHNMRAVLDNLVTSLVPENVQYRSTWPVLWEGDCETLMKKPGIKFLTDDVLSIIDKLQPYNIADENERGRHPLWVLDQLWNRDKHRQIAVFGMLPAGAFVPYSAQSPELKLFAGRVRDGGIVLRVKLPPYIKPDEDPRLAFDIGFDGGPAANQPGWQTLVSLHLEVRKILGQIIPGFTFDVPPQTGFSIEELRTLIQSGVIEPPPPLETLILGQKTPQPS